jgi:hypothetical protein
LALIKQGRAAGLGVVLATQNPADLDYKGLTNAGTWAVGALRAERDKDRVMEGLEGAVAEAGAEMNRRTLDDALGALKPRVFLIHDIREGAPVFFHTRWAMSYLAGPLTRKQVRALMADEKVEAPSVESAAEPAREKASEPEAAVELAGLSAAPPSIPPDVPQVFLPPTRTIESALRDYGKQAKGQQVVYVPHLLALGTVRMLDRKRDVDHQQIVARLVRPDEGALGVDWDAGEVVVSEDDLSQRPVGEGGYEPALSSLTRARDLKRWEKDYSDYLYHNVSAIILYNPTLELYGKVGEGEADFRARCEKDAASQRDAELEKARARVDKQVDSVQKKLRREQRELKTDEADLAARKRDEVLGIGESAFNLLSGRRASTALSKASRKRGMTQKAKADVEESLEVIEDLEEELKALEEEWEGQAAEIADTWADVVDEVEEFEVKPRRADVVIEFCGLAWVPVWRVALENGRQVDLPARE